MVEVEKLMIEDKKNIYKRSHCNHYNFMFMRILNLLATSAAVGWKEQQFQHSWSVNSQPVGCLLNERGEVLF